MLELRNLVAGYSDTVVLRDVSLWLPPASVVALLGPNGAGKTTVLRVASGLLRPTSGRILVDDQDVTTVPADRLVTERGIVLVPEGRGIFPRLTVRENLRLQALGIADSEAIERAVEAFPRLGERLGQVAGTMSGGEQQMLAVARAYVQRPRFVLLDEVSLGLAPLIVDEIFDFLTRLTKQGVGLLVVEQYVTKALALADWVYILNRGEIAFAGEPAELEEGDVFDRYLGLETGAKRYGSDRR